MNRTDFRNLVTSRLVILDGGTGTELASRGMPSGVSPEVWVLENPDILRAMQADYRSAGSEIVYTCTFGANRRKLAEFGKEDEVETINTDLARLSREAVGADALVFGDLAPTGAFVEPFGDLAFDEAVAIYREQAAALVRGGVDGFVIETMMDIQEARAALLAVREAAPELPVIVSMTYGADGRTLTGTDPTAALITLQALGADAVGCNCSTGPGDMLPFVQAMKPLATVPLFAKPNAGMPVLRDGATHFDMTPEAFAAHAGDFVRCGANLLGGCCGTTPAHIAALRTAAEGLGVQAPVLEGVSAVSSARRAVFLGGDRPLAVVGERINPTGKKALQAELREGKLDLVRQYAVEQTQQGAALLDVNMGLSGIDESALMREAVALLSKLVETPLAIDTTDPEVMERALRLYPGRALVNSVSAEAEKLEKTLPVAARYGAMILVLPITDDAIPHSAEERRAVTERILTAAEAYGYTPADVVVDGLVMTVSSEPAAPAATLDFLDWVSRELGANSIVGLSNVSFGLPERSWVNAAFFCMCMARGLSCAIANPTSEILMHLKAAGDALIGRDPKLAAYVKRFAGRPKEAAAPSPVETDPAAAVYETVLAGDAEAVHARIDAALAAGETAQGLVDERLIPAITKVGELFDRKEYFLPQLMMSAEAMKAAMDHLEPQLREARGDVSDAPAVLLATVEGDIHDIGKNLVGLMLKNYGFRVMDLGKDVSAEDIVAAAKETGARVVGLSALMTTTMVEMKEVLALAREAGLETRFMVGGAVVDRAWAEEIGADGYAADAIGAVRLAQSLTTPGGESR